MTTAAETAPVHTVLIAGSHAAPAYYLVRLDGEERTVLSGGYPSLSALTTRAYQHHLTAEQRIDLDAQIDERVGEAED